MISSEPGIATTMRLVDWYSKSGWEQLSTAGRL